MATSFGARLLALPTMRYAASRACPFASRLAPGLPGAGPSGAATSSCSRRAPAAVPGLGGARALVVRAVSNSKKAKKARAAGGKRKAGGARGPPGGAPRSRHGPSGARRAEGTTRPDAAATKPVREELDMAELRIDSLLNELVDGGEGMSNRAKFRALPVDDGIMRRIKERELCTTASQAGREARKLRNKGSDTRVTRRYALYGDVGDAQRDVLGFNGGVKAGVKFIAAATDERSLPPSGDDPADAIPEVAFAGRSNVGKSSLINAVTLSSAARSSDVPGKTQSLNFYDVSRRLRVVDMPGYGFAFAKRERVEAWNRLMDAYLTNRANLKRVYVVVDARHGLKAPDREMLAFLSKYGGVAYGVVLNKTDLVKPADLARRAFLIREELRVAKRARAEVHMASTSTGAGVAELGAEILAFAREAAPGGADAANDRTSERVTFAPRPDDDDDDENARERSSRGGVGGGASSRGGRTAVDEAFERAGYDGADDEDEDGSRSYAGGEWVPGGRPSGARGRRGRGRGRR